MNTNFEGDTRYEYKVGGDTRHENELWRATLAMNTNWEGDTRREE